MNTHLNDLAVIGLSGGEIILIMVVLFFLLLGAALVCGLIYLIVRAAQHQPQQAASSLPPPLLAEIQRKRDIEHIKLLSVFHFVFAGLALLGIGFLFLHYFMMHTIFSNPATWKGQSNAAAPPQVFLDVFVWFYVFVGAIIVIAGVTNVLSGLFLLRRKHRMFSVVVGGLNCLQIPFGTALGVFTILVLSRDSVQELYGPVELRATE
jgi:hypothetical protein